jgi:hypothetical protein
MNKEEVDRQITLSENRATIERDLKNQKKQLDEDKKNYNFTQLSDMGMANFRQLLKKSSQAAELFITVAPMMNNKGVVIASRQTLASLVGCHYNNVGRLIKLLEQYALIRSFKIKGMPVLAINPNVAWRSWNKGKEFAMYNATLLASPEEACEDDDEYEVKQAKAVLALAKKKKGKASSIRQTEFPPPVGEAPEELEVVEE